LGKYGAPETAVHQVNTVKLLLEQSDFTTAQRQMIWRSLIEKYIKAAKADFSHPAKLQDLYHETAQDVKGNAGTPLTG
jgi:hypothetical protein